MSSGGLLLAPPSITSIASRSAGIETQPFVIRDMDGNIVIRDRGRLLFRALFDTATGEFIEGSMEVLANNEAHPGFYVDYCQMAKELLVG
jgi:hypothetical protein